MLKNNKINSKFSSSRQIMIKYKQLMYKRITIVTILTLLFTSCEKDEKTPKCDNKGYLHFTNQDVNQTFTIFINEDTLASLTSFAPAMHQVDTGWHSVKIVGNAVVYDRDEYVQDCQTLFITVP